MPKPEKNDELSTLKFTENEVLLIGLSKISFQHGVPFHLFDHPKDLKEFATSFCEKAKIGERAAVVFKDEKGHYSAIYFFKSDDGVKAFVADSMGGAHPYNVSITLKAQCSEIDMYRSAPGLQATKEGCAIFAISFLTQMLKLEPEILFPDMEPNASLGIKELQAPEMPPSLLKLSQRGVETIKEQFKGSDVPVGKGGRCLPAYFDEHSLEESGKVRNKALLQKAEKYKSAVEGGHLVSMSSLEKEQLGLLETIARTPSHCRIKSYQLGA